jgi:DNA polymerase III subunit epsilon
MKNIENTTASDLAAAEEMLRHSARHRVLERLPEPFSNLPEDLPDDHRICVIVDVETTGLNPTADVIIELGLMWFVVDAEGNVISHASPLGWLEDPGLPLSQTITRITGLTDADVAGRRLDVPRIKSIFDRADLFIAHNASFDLAFLERRFPSVVSKPWACSLREIPWRELGFSCCGLGHLLMEHGRFFDGHRAEADVWATFQLLQLSGADRLAQGSDDNQWTYLKRLLMSSDDGAVRVRAVRLPFDQKDWVKQRGYSWDPSQKVWWKDVPMGAYLFEKAAFAATGLPEPVGTMLDATNRYRT